MTEKKSPYFKTFAEEAKWLGKHTTKNTIDE